MELSSARLLLRNYKNEDWIQIHEYAREPEFSQYDVWGPNSEEDTKFFVRNMILQSQLRPRSKFDLAVIHRASGRLIGGVGIRRDCETSAIGNLGYAIRPEFQRQGFATEAASALFRFAFEDLKMEVVYATCDTRNRASYGVMEKLGMKRVGHLLKHKEYKGAVRDSFRYEITRAQHLKQLSVLPSGSSAWTSSS